MSKCKTELPIHKVRLRGGRYDRVIEIRTPVRLYMVKGGLGSIEIGPLDNATPYCQRLFSDAVNAVAAAIRGEAHGSDISIGDQALTPIPEAITKAFKDEGSS